MSGSRQGFPRNPVFVLGTGRTNSLGVVRCFGRRGIPVYVIDSSGFKPHRFSRYGTVLRSPPLNLADTGLADFLLEKARQQPEPPVLIVTNDQMALYALTYRHQLEPHVRFTSAPLSIARRFLDKAEFCMALREVGVDHPRTVLPTSLEEAEAAAGDIGYPCLLKPANSFLFNAAFGRKAFVVGNRSELARGWHEAREKDLRMLVQEIIPRRRLYLWYGYYDRASNLVAYFGYEKTRQWPPGLGVGCLVRASIQKDKIEMADLILRRLGYHGIVEPEFKYDPRDGRWKILEINVRTITLNRLSASAGLDMEYLAYLEAVGQPLAVGRGDQRERLWTTTAADFASAFCDPSMTIRKWLASRRGPKVYGLFAWDDPLPAAVYFPEAVRRVGSTVLKRWFPKVYMQLRITDSAVPASMRPS
jgi:predicted ATP-grasp superfamily ATP-dependent carboligase